MSKRTHKSKPEMNVLDICPICVENSLEDQGRVQCIKWIQCTKCSQWFHSICLNLAPEIEENLHSYHCDKCSRKHGQSVLKRKSKRQRTLIDYVALDSGEAYAVDKTQHPHLTEFQDFAAVADLTKSNHYIIVADEMSKELAFLSRMKKPILLPNADVKKNGMALPTEKHKFTIDYITDRVGDDAPVVVMDVLTQQGVKPRWNMGQWRDYFKTPLALRDRIRNVISLEISSYDDLGKQFTRPRYVREVDLVDKVWSTHDGQERPQITKYCLMSVKDSFTDFHIDFGGTSVYYTVCSGSKTFLMYPPTEDNLQLYESWCLEPEQNYIWFGKYSKFVNRKKISPTGGFKVTLNAGDLFMIPSGWIHCVHTPEDSIVIGGNYITINDLQMQLKIAQIEKATKVPQIFRFPMFNKVLWYTSWYYYNHQDEYSSDTNNEPPTNRYDILQALIDHLKAHLHTSKANQVARRSIPSDLLGKDITGYLGKLDIWLTGITTANVHNKHIKRESRA